MNTYLLHGKPVTGRRLLAFLLKEKQRPSSPQDSADYQIGDFYYTLDEFIRHVVECERKLQIDKKLERQRTAESLDKFFLDFLEAIKIIGMILSPIAAIGFVLLFIYIAPIIFPLLIIGALAGVGKR